MDIKTSVVNALSVGGMVYGAIAGLNGMRESTGGSNKDQNDTMNTKGWKALLSNWGLAAVLFSGGAIYQLAPLVMQVWHYVFG